MRCQPATKFNPGLDTVNGTMRDIHNNNNTHKFIYPDIGIDY